MAAKRSSSRKATGGKKRTSRAPARKATKRKAAARKRPAAAKRAGSGLEALAKKIVRMSQGPTFGPDEIRALYHPDAVSVEANGQTARGHAELEQKMKGWEQMAASMDAKARNVWTGGGSICIEWDSTVTMRDGRTVQLREIAVHEIEGGKIKSERYYYDPGALGAAHEETSQAE